MENEIKEKILNKINKCEDSEFCVVISENAMSSKPVLAGICSAIDHIINKNTDFKLTGVSGGSLEIKFLFTKN